MSSSTSNSDSSVSNSVSKPPISPHVKAWALAIVGILAIECGLRLFGPSISLDTRHLMQIPSRVRSLDAKPSPKILFMGNSTTREGVDLELLKSRLVESGLTVNVTSVYPDDSYLRDWCSLFGKLYPTDSDGPDMLVVSFTGRWLYDKPVYQPERLAHFFTGSSDFASGVADCNSFTDKARFVIGGASATVVYRDRIRKLVLHKSVPGYEKLAVATNRGRGNPLNMVISENRFILVERLCRMTSERGTKLVFVALPVPHKYEISDALRHTITGNGAALVDLRDVIGNEDGCFLDEVHLSKKGSGVFTADLATELGPHIRAMTADTEGSK